MPDYWLWDDRKGAHDDEDPYGYDRSRTQWYLDDVLRERHARYVLDALYGLIGQEAYAAGFFVGLSLSITHAATSLVGLWRMIVLAEVYDVMYGRGTSAYVIRGFNYTTVKVAKRMIGRDSGIYHRLEAAHEDRDHLVAEVREFLQHPRDALRALPANLRAEYETKWKTLERLNAHPDVANRFEAGKYFGQLVGEVVIAIGGLAELGVVTIETAARAPTLLRIARGLRTAASEDAARAVPKPKEAPAAVETPQSVEPEPVSPTPEPYKPPPLTETTGREMFREVRANLKSAPPEQRADIFDQYRVQMTERSKGQWNAKRIDATNGTMYSGEGGEAIAFDKAGNMYRGPAGRETLGYTPGEGLTIIFDNMKPQ